MAAMIHTNRQRKSNYTLAPLSFLFVILFFVSSPRVHAALVISEIAWMGTNTSANDEWIELQNTGSNPITVDGWRLEGAGDLSIPLSGTVPPDAYVVLERTDDSSAPGSAFLIYTGPLLNSGGTLTLTRTDGNIADQVAGGENWELIGGDNTTKETAQLTSSGWVTNTPSPGSANSAPDTENGSSDAANDTERGSNESTSSSLNTSDDDSDKKKDPKALSLTITGPQQVYVNQDVRFTVTPSGSLPKVRKSLDYAWNLGDLHLETGTIARHAYAYPGEYLITVTGTYYERAASATHAVTVLPRAFTLAWSADGDVLLHNNAAYTVDISHYRLKTDAITRFPNGSKILPRATLTLDRTRIGDLRNGAVLFDAADEQIALLPPRERSDTSNKRTTSVGANTSRHNQAAAPVHRAPESTFSFSRTDPSPPEATTSPLQASVAASGAENGVPQAPWWPYLALLGVILLGGAGLYLCTFDRSEGDA